MSSAPPRSMRARADAARARHQPQHLNTGGVAGGSGPVDPSRENIPADPGYYYHATSRENAYDIQDRGSLVTHSPSYGTDQDMWPDGTTGRRSYWTANPETAKSFYPEGHPTLIRTPRSTQFSPESTGDIYTNKRVPSSKLEVYTGDGQWTPMKQWNTLPTQAPPPPEESLKRPADLSLSLDELKQYTIPSNNTDYKSIPGLARDIGENGIQFPVQILTNGEQAFLENGHHRILAAEQLGLDELPVNINALPDWIIRNNPERDIPVGEGLKNWLRTAPKLPAGIARPTDPVIDEIMDLIGGNRPPALGLPGIGTDEDMYGLDEPELAPPSGDWAPGWERYYQDMLGVKDTTAGPTGAHMWLPTEVVDQFREFDRTDNASDPGNLNTVEQAIAEHGEIRRPLIIDADDTHGLLVEGNHRLAAAKRLGIKQLPVRFNHVKQIYPNDPTSNKPTKLTPEMHGYVNKMPLGNEGPIAKQPPHELRAPTPPPKPAETPKLWFDTGPKPPPPGRSLGAAAAPTETPRWGGVGKLMKGAGKVAPLIGPGLAEDVKKVDAHGNPIGGETTPTSVLDEITPPGLWSPTSANDTTPFNPGPKRPGYTAGGGVDPVPTMEIRRANGTIDKYPCTRADAGKPDTIWMEHPEDQARIIWHCCQEHADKHLNGG